MSCGCGSASAPPGGSSDLNAPLPSDSPRKDKGRGGDDAFNIASFNTLGVSHTGPGGNQHKGWNDHRTGGTISFLKKHNVDVGGLQEFQPSQHKIFAKANTGYDTFGNGPNTIIWKSDRFKKVKSTHVTVPYFEGSRVKMPIVQLEDRNTGKRFWVIDIHNPADTAFHHHQAGFRAEAVRREKAMVEKLRQTGLPVYLMGDFNQGAPANPLAHARNFDSAAPGAGSGVDWIFGSGNVQFSNYERDKSTVAQKVSDHPIVVANTRIT
jgi:endonuclease/exonuclease/phosphatase family metal-dependent hydrolase